MSSHLAKVLVRIFFFFRNFFLTRFRKNNHHIMSATEKIIDGFGKMATGAVVVGEDVFFGMTPIGQLVDAATSDDEKPTAGFQFNELSKLTYRSVNACQRLQDNLLRRVKKKSPVVKFKVLRIIKYLLEKGHTSFRRDLQRRTELIGECLQFRGPPDPLRGDAPYQMVRDEAQEVMNLLYIEIDGNNNNSNSGGGGVQMDAFGGGGGGGGSAHGSSGGHNQIYRNTSSQWEGMGNYDPARDASSSPSSSATAKVGSFLTSIGRSMSDAIETVAGGGSESSSQGGGGYSSSSSMSGFGSTSGSYRAPGSFSGGSGSGAYASSRGHLEGPPSAMASPASLSGAALEREHVPGRAGGFWDSPGAAAPAVASAPPSRHQQQQAAAVQHDHRAVSAASAAAQHEEAGEYEARLVDQIATPSGVRSAPARDALTQFCARCKSLDLEIVLDLLEDKIEARDWRVHLRALHIVDAMFDADFLDQHTIGERFATSGPLLALLQSPKTSVRTKARRVLDRLNVDVSGGAPQLAPVQVAAAPQHLVETSSSNSLFEGLQVGAVAPQPAQSASLIDAFDDDENVAQQPAGPAAAASTPQQQIVAPQQQIVAPQQQIVAPRQTAPKEGEDLLNLPDKTVSEDDKKKALETALIDESFEARASVEKERRAQQASYTLQQTHMAAVMESTGQIPMMAMATAPGVLPQMGTVPGSLGATPTVFMATVAGADGSAVPMMFTGLPMMANGQYMQMAAVPQQQQPEQQQSQPEQQSSGSFSFMNSDAAPVNSNCFDFVNDAIAQEKTKKK
jgi:ENTH domain